MLSAIAPKIIDALCEHSSSVILMNNKVWDFVKTIVVEFAARVSSSVLFGIFLENTLPEKL